MRAARNIFRENTNRPTHSLCSACSKTYCQLQDVKSKIETRYRVRLILDNLPITTYDLERGPESVRPGVWVQSALCSCMVLGVCTEKMSMS